MAQKRMFDRAIIDTDKFMDLSMSSKALYFLLGMEADDEGFVSYKKVMRIHGGNDDDIKVLLAKNFIIGFPSGVVVITDWNKNNWLDHRRIKPTEYQKEKSLLMVDEQKQYSLSDGLARVEESRVEEYRIDSGSENISPLKENFELFWQHYPKKVGKAKALKEWQKLKPSEELTNQIIEHLKARVKTTWVKENKRFVVYAERFIRDCRWEDELEPADKGIALKTNSGMADKIKAKHNL
jgi:hypothetical protein